MRVGYEEILARIRLEAVTAVKVMPTYGAGKVAARGAVSMWLKLIPSLKANARASRYGVYPLMKTAG